VNLGTGNHWPAYFNAAGFSPPLKQKAIILGVSARLAKDSTSGTTYFCKYVPVPTAQAKVGLAFKSSKEQAAVESSLWS
jgi:hypothetical protein